MLHRAPNCSVTGFHSFEKKNPTPNFLMVGSEWMASWRKSPAMIIIIIKALTNVSA